MKILVNLFAVGLVTIGLFLGMRYGLSTHPKTAAAQAVPQIDFPIANCGVFGGSAPGRPTASVTFSWTPIAGASAVWLDLSTQDNGFAPGTFIGAGPLDPSMGTLTWSGLLGGLPHFWRVNGLTPSGWQPSVTGAFNPCGGPQVRFVGYNCTGAGRATANFSWVAPSPPGSSNWLDLSVFGNGFVPGTFLSAGPLSGGQQQLTWPGIVANTPHFWRTNSFIDLFGNWLPSATGTFSFTC